MRLMLLFGVAFLIILPTMVFGQFGKNVEFLGNSLITGTYHDVTVLGDYAYVADSYGLSIFDISDPDTPLQLSTLATPGGSRVLVVSGNYVYIGDELFGLVVADVSNPLFPQIAGYYQIGYWPVADIFIQGNLLYLAAGPAGVYILNISTPAFPVLAGNFVTANFDARGISVTDTLAYVADYWDGLVILNVTRSDSVFVVAELTLPYRMLDIRVQGNYAYVAAADSGMRVVDISNLNNLLEVGSYNIGINPVNKLSLQGTTAYLAYNGSGLHLVNITDPAHPVNISTVLAADVRGVYPVDSVVYIANGYNGLLSLDVTNPSQPVQRGQYQPSIETVLGVYKAGDVAYVTGERRLLTSLDVSNPVYPAVSFDWFWPGNSGVELLVSNNLAFIAAFDQGLQIVNVTDPAAPSLVGSFDTPGAAYGIDLQGNYAYVADGDSGLRIIDVTDPTNPIETGYYDSVRTTKVKLAGNYAYLIHPEFGLYVVDISDPVHPAKIGQLPLSGWASDIQVVGDLAFLACADLTIVSLSNPSQPQLISQQVFLGGPRAVFVEGNYAYLLTDYGLFIVDVANINNILRVGEYNIPGYGYDVFVENQTIYVAGYYDLGIYHFTPSTSIEKPGKALLSQHFLYQNYPNPFNPSTIIEFELTRSGKISLIIYNLLGEQVDQISWNHLPAGYHRYQWNGEGKASGVYIYRLETDNYVMSKKMLLLR